jgi:hypothetical protein
MKRAAGYRLFFLVLLSIGLAGCSGSNGMMPTPTPTPIPFFSGLFEIQAFSNTGVPIFRLQGNLTQNGNSMSGIMHLAMLSCVSFNTDIQVTGTLSNAPDFRFDLGAVLPGGQNLSFSLSHPNGQGNFTTGPYSFTGAAGCGVPAAGGALLNAMGLTGAWRATFNSSGGTTSQMSMALTQTGPDAHGFFSATGTATITGGTCFSSATVDPASLLIGTGSQLILDNSQPGSSGKTILQGHFGPLAFGGEFFNGTYTSTQGACSESGTVLMETP